jgi:xylulokinase
MSELYVISYDLGTSGVKVALVSTQGQLVAFAEQGYPLITPQPGWAEQDPNAYWSAISSCTRQVMKEAGQDPADAAGITISTQWKGIIPVDADGRILYNNILWLDSRAETEAKILNHTLKTDMFTAQSYWARLMWLRNHCYAVYEQAEHIFEVNSYIRWKLTGFSATDLSNDFIHSCDPELDSFYMSILKAADLDRNKFPPLVKSTDPVGFVTTKAAREIGLRPGIPVFAGCADIPAIAIGSGCVERHSVHAYFGTSGWIGAVFDHDMNASKTPSSAFTPELDIALFSMQSVGLTLNWAIQQFYSAEHNQLGGHIFNLLNQELSDITPGSDGLLATPWLSGELPPLSDKARVAFIGAGAKHDRRHFVKAIMESVCYSMRERMLQCEKRLGHTLDALTVVGGGASSPLWMQMLADVLQVPVEVPHFNKHTGAIGSAYCALLGLGLCSSLTETRERVGIAQSYMPRTANIGVYDQMYQVFTTLYKTVEPVFEKLQQIQ